MRIALLADVHANLPALDKVVEHAKAQGVDEFWNLGDVVGYAPFPNQVIESLRKICSRHISGNYDVKSLDLERIEKMQSSGKDQDKVFSFSWTNQALTEDSRHFLQSLPEILSVTVGRKKVLLTHGSPEGPEDGLTARTAPGRFKELAGKVKENIVLCGHTHEFFRREAGDVTFVNPGSVGRPFDGDPRAAYAVLEIIGAKVNVFPFRVEYDLNELVRAMEEQRFPERLISTFVEARSLDDLDLPPSASDEEVLAAVLELARTCHYEKEHSQQVTSLALRIFDALKDVHGLGLRERLLLQSAGFLHDIGLVYGVEGHHKSSRDLIMKSDKLLFTEREKTIVSLITRYHRKGLPEPDHKYYSDLVASDRTTVDTLSAILRVADGLDRTHRSVVKDVALHILPDKISITISASTEAGPEITFAKQKGDLFEKVFGRELVVSQ
jgi:putative phosphoesterase